VLEGKKASSLQSANIETRPDEHPGSLSSTARQNIHNTHDNTLQIASIEFLRLELHPASLEEAREITPKVDCRR